MPASPLCTSPQSNVDLTAFIDERALSAPTDEAFRLLFRDQPAVSISNEMLRNGMERWSRALCSGGVSTGDVVLLTFEHSSDLIFAFFGALRARAIPSVLPPSSSGKTTGYRDMVLERAATTQAKVLVTNTALNHDLSGHLSVIDTPSDGDTETNSLSIKPPGDIAYIQFTGGTTGSAKALALSHHTIAEYVRRTAKALSITANDRTVGWLPLHHDMGLVTQVLTPLLTGSSATIISPADWIRRPEVLFRAISEDGGTITWMPNFAFRHCLRRIRPDQLIGVDLSTLRIVGSGSEPVQAVALKKFWATYEPYGLKPEASTVGYGAAEHVAGVSLTPPDTPPLIDWVSKSVLTHESRAEPSEPEDESAVPIVSCGYPKDGINVQVIGEHGEQLEDRHLGEITICSDLLFTGYIGQPELTQQVIRNGWFHTGDVGYLAEGQLYVCGRKSDVLITSGKTIHPHHIEEIVLQQMGQRARLAVAFGISDVDLGTQMAVAVCELREQVDLETLAHVARRIRQTVSERLGIGLADIRFVEKGWITRGTSGKLGRSRCRRKYLDSGFNRDIPERAPAALAEDDIESQLQQIWGSILGVDEVGVHEDFFDLGGTSILAVELMAEIEYKMGNKLPPATLIAAPTVTEQALLLRGKLTPPGGATLVPVQTKGQHPPLFCCTGILGGGIFTYMGLSKGLGRGQPCYVLQPRGMNSDEEARTNLHQIARDHVQEIKRVQPEGPYQLCGSSFGGLVAYEIAQQLRRQGDEVALVAMFDTYSPSATHTLRGSVPWKRIFRLRGRLSRLRIRIEFHTTILSQGDWPTRKRYVSTKAGKLLRRWRMKVRPGPVLAQNGLPVRLAKVKSANIQALRNYQPKPYPGKVILFRATHQHAGVPPDNGWGGTMKPEIRHIRGYHGALDRMHLVTELKHFLLNRCIDNQTPASTFSIHSREDIPV